MKYALLILLLSASLSAQTFFSGPLTGGPIAPSQCATEANTTGLCFTSNGVYVSIAGAPFTGPLPAQAPVVTVGTTQTLPAGSQAVVSAAGTPQNVNSYLVRLMIGISLVVTVNP